jgi:hypothetical protein
MANHEAGEVGVGAGLDYGLEGAAVAVRPDVAR